MVETPSLAITTAEGRIYKLGPGFYDRDALAMYGIDNVHLTAEGVRAMKQFFLNKLLEHSWFRRQTMSKRAFYRWRGRRKAMRRHQRVRS